MNNDPTAAGEDCILASLERPSNYRLYYNAADALLEAGHAVVYDGGTKTHDWGAE